MGGSYRRNIQNIKLLIILLCIGIIISATLPLIPYLLKFNNGLSENASDWGNFGSYYGSIVSTLFNSITTILLLISILYQRKQMDIDRKENQDSSKNILKQLELTDLLNFQNRFSTMIHQRNVIIDSYARGNESGMNSFRKDMIQIRKDEHRLKNPSQRDIGDPRISIELKKKVSNNLANYLNLFNYLITISYEIMELPSDERKQYYFRTLRYSLSDAELSLLIFCKERKELSHDYRKNIENIMGEFRSITLDDIISEVDQSVNSIAIFKGINRLI